MGDAAENAFRSWLKSEGVELAEKQHTNLPGVDAERIGGTHLGWDWAELKPNTVDSRWALKRQLRGRYSNGITGEGAGYVYDTNGGGAFAFKLLFPPNWR